MTKIKDLFISSSRELKDVKVVTLTAMFGAISIILASFTIMLFDFVKIQWTFLPNEFVYYLFGPFVGIFYGAALDVLNYFVYPVGGPFFPGFTISAMLTGLLYGLLLYKRPLSIKRIITVNIIRTVFIDLGLNTFWLTMLKGNSFIYMLPIRALKLLIMLPVETILLYILIKSVEASGILKVFSRRKAEHHA